MTSPFQCTARNLRKIVGKAGTEAGRKLGLGFGGYSIACAEGHAGFSWYGWETKHPEKGSVKLEAEPLPQSMCLLEPGDPEQRKRRHTALHTKRTS